MPRFHVIGQGRAPLEGGVAVRDLALVGHFAGVGPPVDLEVVASLELLLARPGSWECQEKNQPSKSNKKKRKTKNPSAREG